MRDRRDRGPPDDPESDASRGTQALRLKSALATHLLGVVAADIAAVNRDESEMQSRILRHAEYFRLWSERGFTPMFRRFPRNERVKQRLIGRPNGERRLTNILHLAELIHRASEDENLGVGALVKWLGRQLDPQMQRSEENQLRLESDALAVKIVTVHRSKGLEYPVVFCPFAWSGSALRSGDFFFHDPQNGNRLTADLSGERTSSNRILAQNEATFWGRRIINSGSAHFGSRFESVGTRVVKPDIPRASHRRQLITE